MTRFFSYLMVATISLGAGYYFAIFTQPTAQLSYVATTTPALPSEPFTTIELKENTATHSVDVAYPKFGIPAIDTKIEEVVRDAVADFKSLPPNPPDMASPQHELTIRFDLPYISNDIVSFKLIISQYTGGAHSNAQMLGMNFDLTGKQILLHDVLNMISLSLKQVSVASTAQLKERLGESFSPEGAEPNSKNFESFLISKDKVTFIFQEYQVGPYAAGPQEVSFERVR